MSQNAKSNGVSKPAVNGLVKQHRHSLQHNPSELPLDNFRHTQSHRYDSEGKKKNKRAMILAPIPSTISEGSENESEAKPNENKSEKSEKKSDQYALTVENEKRISKSSKKSEKSNYAFENAAYDGNSDKRSISSRAGSSRQPSVQSLEVVREQYCCCARRNKCEKRLLIAVTVLSIMVVVLIIVVAFQGSSKKLDGLKLNALNGF